jgi:hypothetical protein
MGLPWRYHADQQSDRSIADQVIRDPVRVNHSRAGPRDAERPKRAVAGRRAAADARRRAIHADSMGRLVGIAGALNMVAVARRRSRAVVRTTRQIGREITPSSPRENRLAKSRVLQILLSRFAAI